MAVKRHSSTLNFQTPSIITFTNQLFEILSRASRVEMNRFLDNTKNMRLPKFNVPPFNKKNIFKYLLPIVIVLLAVFLIRQALSPRSVVNGVITEVSDTKPLATMALNRSFSFPLRDGKGKEVGKLSYTIKDAELRKQIIVKGKRATAIKGRIFLILNLKIVNSLNQGLEVNSRDYIRFTVNGNTKELFAPDIHNDPVEVQAISTKNTRVGIAINETDKNIELQIGEINGEKQKIKLSFNR